MSAALVDRLRAALGGAGEVAPGSERWAVHGVVPGAVVAPNWVEGAAAVLALASEEGWSIEPAGAGTRLDHGRPPHRVDVVLAAARLTSLGGAAPAGPDHAPADLVSSVAAGLPFAELVELLAAAGQWLPLDLPASPESTTGAAAATASAGPLRLGYGTPRDHVLGLELVTGDGRTLRLGGRVVKNVAGFDLVRLAIGSRGTLGLITRLELKLRPLPEADATVEVAAAGPEPLLEASAGLLASAIRPVALELCSPPPVGPSPQDRGWRLLARFHGTEECVRAATGATAGIRGGAGHGPASAAAARVLDAGEAAAAWKALARDEGGAALVVRLADRPARLAGTLGLAAELAGSGTARAVAHAGNGIVRLLVPTAAAAAASPDAWAAVLDDARCELAARGGTLLVPRAPRALLERFDPHGPVPARVLAIMRGLKAELDPAGVLAPGRFVV